MATGASQSKRKISPCLFRYIATGFAIPFICALLGFTALFLLNNVFDDLPDFLEKNVSAWKAIVYFLALQPSNLVNVIPISALLGASFMTLMLGRSSELTAMRAAGLSLMTCALPVWLIAGAACFIVFAINESWGPACSKKAEQILIANVSKNKGRHHISFHNPQAHRDWNIHFYHGPQNMQALLLRQFHEDGTCDYLLSAKSASYDEKGWLFQDGHIQKYLPDGKNLKEDMEFFHEKRIPYPETPQDIASHSRNYDVMNIGELRNILLSGIVSSRKTMQLVRTLIWYRLTFPLASLVGALFGVALTIATGRTGLMKGFASAVGLLVLFYLVGQSALVLAKNGWLPAFLGGAFPNLAFLAGGAAAMWKKQ